jgi:hypothetical protein
MTQESHIHASGDDSAFKKLWRRLVEEQAVRELLRRNRLSSDIPANSDKPARS